MTDPWLWQTKRIFEASFSNSQSLFYFLLSGNDSNMRMHMPHLPPWSSWLLQVFRIYSICDCKLIVTPIDLTFLAAAISYQCIYKFSLQYQLAIGSLIYTMLGTRFNLDFAIFAISKYTSNLNSVYWQAVKWMICYLKDNLKLQLTFQVSP